MPATATVSVLTYFAPFDDTTSLFLKFVASAQKSIDTVIYGMHLPAFEDLLIEKHRQGVRISLVLDHSQSAGKAEAQEVRRLVDAGVPLIIGTSPMHGQILHSKFTVVDGHAVEHGSWNYSLSAAAQSNTMCFVDDAAYAAEFLKHHDRLIAFIKLHEHITQPTGATLAEVAVPVSEAPVESPPA